MAEEIDKAGFWKNQWRKIQTLPNEWISLLILLFRPAVVILRIPGHSGHRFQSNPDTYSI